VGRVAASHPELKERLEALVSTRDLRVRVQADPVSLVHRFDSSDDREVAGLVAALLAFGRVDGIRRSAGRVLQSLGPHPADAIAIAPREDLARRLRGFAHRIYRGPDLASLLWNAASLRRTEGSLGGALARRLEDTGGDVREALARWADQLRGPHPSRSLAHLVPDPRAASACKRLWLYLRWMIRGPDGVDMGIWDLQPSLLLIPLDTHVHRISVNLGLTSRRTASWRAAQDVTRVLCQLDPLDPVRYDFALCHLGISRECPSRRDPVRCHSCVLRTVCRVWRPTRSGRRAVTVGESTAASPARG